MLTISCDYTVAYLQLPVIGEAQEDCTVKASGLCYLMSHPITLIMHQRLAIKWQKIGACVLLDLA